MLSHGLLAPAYVCATVVLALPPQRLTSSLLFTCRRLGRRQSRLPVAGASRQDDLGVRQEGASPLLSVSCPCCSFCLVCAHTRCSTLLRMYFLSRRLSQHGRATFGHTRPRSQRP